MTFGKSPCYDEKCAVNIRHTRRYETHRRACANVSNEVVRGIRDPNGAREAVAAADADALLPGPRSEVANEGIVGLIPVL